MGPFTDTHWWKGHMDKTKYFISCAPQDTDSKTTSEYNIQQDNKTQ